MIFDPKMLQVYLVGGTQDVHNDVVKFLEKVELAMKSGITAFQYREKGNSKSAYSIPPFSFVNATN